MQVVSKEGGERYGPQSYKLKVIVESRSSRGYSVTPLREKGTEPLPDTHIGSVTL